MKRTIRSFVIWVSLILALFLALLLIFSLAFGDLTIGISEAILVMAFLSFILFIIFNRKLIEAEKKGNWDKRLVRFLTKSESPVWPIILLAILVYFVVEAFRRADIWAYLSLGLFTFLVLITTVRYIVHKLKQKPSSK